MSEMDNISEWTRPLTMHWEYTMYVDLILTRFIVILLNKGHLS